MWFKYSWIVEFGIICLGIWVYNSVNKTRRKDLVIAALIVAGFYSLLYFMGEIG